MLFLLIRLINDNYTNSSILRANNFKYYFRLLPLVQDNFWFKVLCFVVRGLEAIGASAFSTSSFVYVIQLFPDNVSSVLVSIQYSIIIICCYFNTTLTSF